ncbi:MAG: hypothetical protein LBB93_05405 [Elusimicrobiota bacterium]|jgi:hypothetical protein|nr:hypothetical protein [Elusimicrobiota bacterium]
MISYDEVFSKSSIKKDELGTLDENKALTIPESANLYLLTTAACKEGIYEFIKKSNFPDDKKITPLELLDLTKGEIGHDFYKEYLKTKSTALIDKYLKEVKEGREEKDYKGGVGKPHSTEVILHNLAHAPGGGDLYIKAILKWAASEISVEYAHTGQEAKLRSEYVWYDLYVKEAKLGESLTETTGVYGSSSWRLVNKGAGYAIEK